jgi:hypothetical protein
LIVVSICVASVLKAWCRGLVMARGGGSAAQQSTLAAGSERAIDCLESIFPEDAIVPHAFDLDEPAIGCKPRAVAAD